MAFRLGVCGFDLQTRLQINATPKGKSKIHMTLNLYTGMNTWCSKMTGKKKSNSESVIHFQINETKCAGNASPQSAAPAAAVVSFYILILSKTEVLPTYAYIHDNRKYIKHHVYDSCDCDSILTCLSCRPEWKSIVVPLPPQLQYKICGKQTALAFKLFSFICIMLVTSVCRWSCESDKQWWGWQGKCSDC